jgi:hypothetical protein
MPNALQQVVHYAVVTDNAVAKKISAWAEQPEIVERLDNGNTAF